MKTGKWNWFKYTNLSRAHWLYFFTSLGLISGILLTLPQWSAVRTYPLVPVIPGFFLPTELHTLLTIVCLLALLGGLLLRQYRPLLTSLAIASLGILSLLDITRFHPWILHYLAILLLFSGFSQSNNNQRTRLLDAARVVVGGIYFWSGIQKLNSYFVSAVFPWFTQPIWEFAPELLLGAFVSFGLLVPLIEAGFAVGLFTKKFRTVSVLGSTGMVLIVLFALGPFGHNWNSSVWPWNIALFCSVIVLFLKTDFTFLEFIKRIRTNTAALAMVAIFWLLPIGNMFGYVDGYVSWSLYSGHVPEATLTGDQLLLETLSPAAQDGRLSYVSWTHTEMNQIPYPAERVFQSVFISVCERFENDPSLRLEIITPEYFNTLNRPVSTYSCK